MRNYIRIFTIIAILFYANLGLLGQTQKNNNLSYNSTYAKELYKKGINYGREGQLDSALYSAYGALEIILNTPETDSTLLANVYQSLGIIHKLLGGYNKAIEYYTLAETIYIKTRKEYLLALVYSNKANIFLLRQDYSKSEIYQKQAIQILESDSIKYKNQLGNFYNNLANVYKRKNDYLKAIKFYKKSLTFKSDLNRYNNYSNLAYCYSQLNQAAKAEHFHKLAIKTVQEKFETPNNKVAQQLMYYATFLGSQNQTKKSFILFNKTLNIYHTVFGEKHPNISTCYNSMGELYLKNNNVDSALIYFQKSLIALSPDFNSLDYNKNPDFSNILSETHLLRPLKNKALALNQKASYTNLEGDYLLSLETSEYASKLFQRIKRGYVNEESKLFLAENEFSNLSLAITTCNNLHTLTQNDKYIHKAFLFSELGKASVLNETMQNSEALQFGGIPDSLLLKEKELEKTLWNYEELIYEENNSRNPDHNKLKYWNKYLFDYKKQYSELLNYFETNFSDYHNLKHQEIEINIVNTQKELSRDESIIEYFIADSILFTFLINKNNTYLYSKSIDSSFYSLANKFIQNVSNSSFSHHKFTDFNQFQKTSYDLYSILIAPLANNIKNNSLIIIPDGILSYIPFEALTNQNLNYNRINYRELPYLIHKHPISYAHAVPFIKSEKTSKTAAKPIAAFAPSYKIDSSLTLNEPITRQRYREKLYPLKGVKEEVLNITQIIEGDRYINQEANETIFKNTAHNYDILHLAMHTVIDDNNPMYSKMAFTQSSDSLNDGFLNTYELYNLKLNSRMAVLSSCNSGSGKLQRGEGVISLARGFIYAGCPSIIMTLWTVEDKSGVDLMTSFYKQLSKGYSKSESLRKAKINFIQSGDQLKSHPYFWSGYVAIGSNDALYLNKLRSLIYFITTSGIILFIFLIVKRKKSNREV